MSVLIITDWPLVESGKKTLHLFPPRKGEELIEYRAIYVQRGGTWHLKFETGQTRNVQTSTGSGAVGAVRITQISHIDDVRQLTDAQITATGYASRHEFLLRWAQLHARSTYHRFGSWMVSSFVKDPAKLEAAWANMFAHSTAPSDHWDAWALQIEAVR